MKSLVLFTSSRTWTDRAAIGSVLTDIFDERGAFHLTHGDARGGDTIAHEWALAHEHLGIVPNPYPTTAQDWNTHGMKAGPMRNERMVSRALERMDMGFHVECVAFLLPCSKLECRRPGIHPTHGGAHCSDLARREGIPTTIYTDGDFS